MPSYYVDEDYPARPEIQQPLPERSNRCDLESSTLETDVYVLALCTPSGACHKRRRRDYSTSLFSCYFVSTSSLRITSRAVLNRDHDRDLS